MNAKENALRTIKFDNPAYVPRNYPGYFINYNGANHEGYNGGGHNCPVGTHWTDIWGVEWVKIDPNVMGFHIYHPLAEMEDFDHYVWPDPDDQRISGVIYEAAERMTEQDKQEKFIIGSHRETLFEKANTLLGMDNLMVYMYTDPDYVKDILHRIMDFQLGIAKHYVNCGIEMAQLGDDLGTQHSLLLSKEMIYEFFVPEYRRLFQFYKDHNVLIRFHSCGHIEPLLEMFIELGVDILNPVQETANDLEKVIQVTRGRMAIEGAISTALLESGPVEAIDAELKRVIGILDQNGGFFCCNDQAMPIPKQHMEAMWAAVEKYGKR